MTWLDRLRADLRPLPPLSIREKTDLLARHAVDVDERVTRLEKEVTRLAADVARLEKKCEYISRPSQPH